MPIERKLAAIMFTDIVGYTAQMSKDEAVAISLLNKQESILKPLIAKHNGTYVKSTGDGSLSYFESAVNAATCAGCMDTLAVNYDVAATINSGCSYGISGQLKDNNGDNVENAAILLTYDLWQFGRINMPCTYLTYALPTSSDVYLWIESMCGDTINVIVDEYRDAGYHSVIWCADDLNGNTVVDGNYKTHLITNGTESSQNIFLLQYDFSELESIGSQNYHAMTDNNGIFRIPFDCLSFGIELLGMDEFGNPTDDIVVPYKTQVWIIHNDYPTFSTDWYDVDSDNGVYLNIDIPIP